MTVRDKYNDDPAFRALVETMTRMLFDSMLTTSDLAQAAVLAAQLYAERNYSPIMIVIEDHRQGPYRSVGEFLRSKNKKDQDGK